MPLTKLNNKAVANVTSIPVSLGDMVLVSSATASSSASIEFSLGNYKEYKFFFVNIHPQNDGVQFRFQTSTDGGSNYGVTNTSTYFIAYQNEAGTENDLTYITGSDQAQTTNDIALGSGDNANDSGIAGTLQIFNPSSTTYVKHWINRSINDPSSYAQDEFQAGYFNTTSALTNIRFQMSSGNINDGKILMFGIN